MMGYFALDGVLVHDAELLRFVRAACRDDDSLSADAAYVGQTIARMIPEVQDALEREVLG